THTAEQQRVQKTLEDVGIKLDSVASDVLGVSGSVDAAGLDRWCTRPRARGGVGAGQDAQQDPAVAGGVARPVHRAPRDDVARQLGHVDYLESAIAELDDVIDGVMALSVTLATGWTRSSRLASGRLSASSPRSAST